MKRAYVALFALAWNLERCAWRRLRFRFARAMRTPQDCTCRPLDDCLHCWRRSGKTDAAWNAYVAASARSLRG